MKAKFLTRISDILSSTSSISTLSSSVSGQDWASPSKVTTSDSYYHTLQIKPFASNKTPWASLKIGKKGFKKSKKRNDIPATEWFASPLTADRCDVCEHTGQSFYDEKVEILAPSASVASFISSSSTTSLPRHIPYYFSPVSTSSGLQSNQKNQHPKSLPLTPLKSIGEREDSGINMDSEKKNNAFRPTVYKRLSTQVYSKDDFYD
ncbi:hypothetical protein V8B55DRAFT_1474204 [Mucor lusitanicus]|uniref:Uncharacterized protein n=2 Tax=Mucor circinelloides f. lusitanicus TaxID=29924 RepID=A0A168PFU3_MUCCL|nr:hypothetical protein FB192DRAFT_1374791 [Mucor lusitanicus]OAD07676.1 hypothetical protein MUCCIDRAFT_104615 [Mucor lusitanicus CBS 277.49]